MQLEDEILYSYKGGLSSTLLNALVRAGTFIYDFGKSIGDAIRRATTNNLCKF